MDEKILFNLMGSLKTSTWNLFTATLINTLKKDEGYKKPKNKKNIFTKDENSLLLDILKKYYEWLHLFRKDVVTLPQY